MIVYTRGPGKVAQAHKRRKGESACSADKSAIFNPPRFPASVHPTPHDTVRGGGGATLARRESVRVERRHEPLE
jgi:hypothetical protein